MEVEQMAPKWTILSFLMRTMQLAKIVTVIKLLGKVQAVAGKATFDKKTLWAHLRFTTPTFH